MRAALCKSLNGSKALVVEDVPEPAAGPGEAVVKVRAAALNFFDTLITRGTYQSKPALPFSPSGEIAGVVESVGPGVTGLAPGDRVAAYVGWGGAREKLALPASSAIPIPPGISDDVAAGISVTYGTALHGLKDRAKVRPGESVAVLGASGGAGLAAVEIAKLLGARVIAGASSGAKLEICKAHGADEVINYDEADLKVALRDLTAGHGANVVYDCVGDRYAEPAIRALAWEGRYLVVGFAAGEIPRIPLNLLMLRGAAALGVFWGDAVRRNPTGHRTNMIELMNWVASKALKPRTHGIFPLESIVDAMSVIERREATGKVILKL